MASARTAAAKRLPSPFFLGSVLAAVVLADTAGLAAQPPSDPPVPGVSETLARERAARLSNVRYDISFSIPAERRTRVTGREILTFTLHDAAAPLVLDFAPGQPTSLHVEANGRTVEMRPLNGHLILPVSALRAGVNRAVFEFEAGDAPLNRSDDFLYTIFVPARAHEAFPCFDQPDLKAHWKLELEVPAGWDTLANGAESSRETSGGRTRLAFEDTQPIATYLFAFAAGRFSVERAERHGRTFRMFHRETDAGKVARNRETIFDLHAAALDWLERYTGTQYPFGKFDFLLVPAFQFGGMEHPGAIFYNAPGLMLEESATQNQRLDRASTIAHETAHMWFGDLVTMQWFSDVWMKEVFANVMAAKIVNPSFPEIDHELRFLLEHYPAAYDVDRTAGTNAIRQPLANLHDAGTLYGAIIYHKAPIVMRQLERLLGPGAFREGLREYLRRYAFANASWPDLIAELGAHTKEDLGVWSHAWVAERGRPIIRTELAVANGRIERLALTQRDPYPARGLTWDQQIDLAIGYSDHVDTIPIRLMGPSVEVLVARGRAAPAFVLPNGGGLGYGEFHLDRDSLQWLLEHVPEVPDALTRGGAWVTLWDALLDAETSLDRLVDLALRALPKEADELNTQRILGYLRVAFWWSTPDTRASLAPRVEAVLRGGLAAATTSSLKGAYFSALRDVALTPDTLDWLTAIWRREIQVPGLTLAETDEIALAQEISVRGGLGWKTVLDGQLARTTNPDRRARLQFILPALSAEAADRDAFFASLGDVANRRHESWVIDGLRYLHHPLRAVRSERYIPPSLELLQEIQRTGDIFFPGRWMDVTLAGHRSEAAAQIVRTFVARLPPAYPDRLRRIILTSADPLFRVIRLVDPPAPPPAQQP